VSNALLSSDFHGRPPDRFPLTPHECGGQAIRVASAALQTKALFFRGSVMPASGIFWYILVYSGIFWLREVTQRVIGTTCMYLHTYHFPRRQSYRGAQKVS
jgi:hypothetical protein